MTKVSEVWNGVPETRIEAEADTFTRVPSTLKSPMSDG